MNILIIGAGAIGMWLAAQVRAPHRVTLVGRSAFKLAADANGVVIDAPGAVRSNMRCNFADGLAQAGSEAYDAIIFVTKAHALARAAHELRQFPNLFKPATQLVAFQNGIGSEAELARQFPSHPIVAGTTTVPVTVLAVNHIRIDRARGGAAVAPCSAGVQVSALAAATGAIALASGERLKWSKLLLNLVGNAGSAIFDCSVGELYAHPATFKMEYAMLREALSVMDASNIQVCDLPGGKATQLASALRVLPTWLLKPLLGRIAAKGRGDKRPSFYHDLANATGHSEVQFLNGAVAAYAQRLGLRAPVNAALTQTLTSLVNDVSGWPAWRGKLDRAAEFFA